MPYATRVSDAASMPPLAWCFTQFGYWCFLKSRSNSFARSALMRRMIAFVCDMTRVLRA